MYEELVILFLSMYIDFPVSLDSNDENALDKDNKTNAIVVWMYVSTFSALSESLLFAEEVVWLRINRELTVSVSTNCPEKQ